MLDRLGARGVWQVAAAALCAIGLSAAPMSAPAASQPAAGRIVVSVDATDLDRRILKVEQTIAVQRAGTLTLHYARWLPGTHGPWEDINELAGLQITAGGQSVAWRRDVLDPFSFHLTVPPAARELTVRFDHISPLSWAQRRPSITRGMMNLRWNQTVLYPAGQKASDIRVEPRVRLPSGWQYASALRDAVGGRAQPGADGWVNFGETSLETLVDSPLVAGRHVRRIELDPPGTARPVMLTLLADEAGQLDATPAQIDAHRRLVEQADRLFGTRPWRHYDMMLTLSAEFGRWGLEHQESSESGARPNYFRDWDKSLGSRWIIPHEFLHAWNGKYRRPDDLLTPNFNVPMRNSLLWVYEGLTQYLEWVLTARSGLGTTEQTIDQLAAMAASMQRRSGRAWRNLQDTTNDSTIMSRRATVWPDWQRDQDYYTEGALLWLEADTLIRQASGDTRSLDDFLKAFFGVEPARHPDGSIRPLAYTFDDLVGALNTVQPLDWAGFWRTRLDRHDAVSLEGIVLGGWKLAWADRESEFARNAEVSTGPPGRTLPADFLHSLGVAIAADGRLQEVGWGSPAFNAGLTARMSLVAVNMQVYRADRLSAAIAANSSGQAPLQLLLREDDAYLVKMIDWRGGLRHPRLVRDSAVRDRLAQILAPK